VRMVGFASLDASTGVPPFPPTPGLGRPGWFSDLVALVTDGPGKPDTIDGVVEQRVREHGQLLDFRYRVQRRGNLVRATDLAGAVHYVAGENTAWVRTQDRTFESEPRRDARWFSTPDDYGFGAYRDGERRWKGDDYTTPIGASRSTTYLGRAAVEVDLAPPPHKGDSPLTVTIDQLTGLILCEANAGGGTHSRWVTIDLDADLADHLFELHDTDNAAAHDY
jgi:hypothetical protein